MRIGSFIVGGFLLFLAACAPSSTGNVANFSTGRLDSRFDVPESYFAYQSAIGQDTMSLVSASDRRIYHYLAERIGVLDVQMTDLETGKPKIGSCTATILRDNIIITAKHCLYRGGTATKAIFRPNFTNLDGTTSKVFRVVLPPIETSGGTTEWIQNRDLDYAILRLDTEQQLFRDALPARRAEIGEDLFVLGHPNGSRLHASEDQCVTLQPAPIDGDNLMPHGCDTVKGFSGALLFAKSDSAFVGMHVQGSERLNDEREVNRATKVESLVANSPFLQSIYSSLEFANARLADGVARAPVSAIGETSFEAATRFKYVDGRWLDGPAPILEPLETALKYCSDTIGNCGIHGDWRHVAPQGHDPKFIGVIVCGQDGNYYQLTVDSDREFEYVKIKDRWQEINSLLRHHTGEFATNLSRFRRTRYGDILLDVITNTRCKA